MMTAAEYRSVRYTKKILGYLALAGVSFLFLLPFLWMVSTSLKPDFLLYRIPPVWIPNPPLWENFGKALRAISFAQQTGNTLMYALTNTTLVTISSALVAYGFSRIKWPGRDALFFVVILTMLLPYQVTMIPVYLIFRTIGWTNSLKPLIWPGVFGSAFYIFLLRQFFLTIPQELSEAARIDGCNELQIFWKIILPLVKPALVVVILFQFVGTWNDFMGPLIYVNDPAKYTLSLGLQQFQVAHGAEWQLLMAASTVVAAPIIVLFFIFQRAFVEGITLTGLKG